MFEQQTNGQNYTFFSNQSTGDGNKKTMEYNPSNDAARVQNIYGCPLPNSATESRATSPDDGYFMPGYGSSRRDETQEKPIAIGPSEYGERLRKVYNLLTVSEYGFITNLNVLSLSAEGFQKLLTILDKLAVAGIFTEPEPIKLKRPSFKNSYIESVGHKNPAEVLRAASAFFETLSKNASSLKEIVGAMQTNKEENPGANVSAESVFATADKIAAEVEAEKAAAKAEEDFKEVQNNEKS